MRRLSLKDICYICEHIDIEDIFDMNEYWVVLDTDGAWETKKDCNGEPTWYPARDSHKLAINNRISESDKIVREEEEDRKLQPSDEYINMRGYNEKNMVGMEGAFSTVDFREFEL